jgi:IS1 family transposase
LDEAAKVISLLTEGMGIRGTSRVTGLHQQTVLNILEAAGKKCAKLLDARIRNVPAENVEVDELYSYVRTRPENTDFSDPLHGEMFCFLGIDRGSKLIVSHLLGKRLSRNCVALMDDMKSRLAGRTQLSTDGFPAYMGEAGAVGQAFGTRVDYGIEVKRFGREEGPPGRYRPARCIGVTRTAQIGAPDLSTIGTCRVERMNLSVRHFTRRFTRSTLGYSKTFRNHRHATALFIAHYNFCRTHSSLRNGIARTPAMAAGLTDHVWAIEELMNA